MKFRYFAETDTLYIELSPTSGAAVVEIAPGFVVDLDQEGRPVGIEIDRASRVVDLTSLEAESLPLRMLAVA